MKVSLFGLGYVGCVTAGCLAKAGHQVWGVDVNHHKVEMINSGRSPIIEEEIDQIIGEEARGGRLSATTDHLSAIRNTEISLICVGTPSNSNGSLNLEIVRDVCRQIGEALRQKETYHCLVLRSTVLPGTIRDHVIPILTERSGKRVDIDFDLCFNPEFLREGSSVHDFYHPPFTIIGQRTDKGGDAVADLYHMLSAPVERTSVEVAETVKYVCNTFHALKVAFANEMGLFCKGLGIDSHPVMELFARDRKLNISPAYLKPGFAFGGSCLPKDLRALLYRAKEMDVGLPVLNALLESNRLHIQRVVDMILGTRKKKIGILGLSFKAGTDDLRESPMVTLVEALIGKGCWIRIYDSNVSLAKIFGANKEYIEKEIPHISSLMYPDIDKVIQEAEVIIIGNRSPEFKEALKPYMEDRHRIILDLVRIAPDISAMPENYHGICW